MIPSVLSRLRVRATPLVVICISVLAFAHSSAAAFADCTYGWLRDSKPQPISGLGNAIISWDPER